MHLSVATKQRVYLAVVLSTLLYGAETWTVKAAHLRRMNTFHFDCVHTILSETRRSQWSKRLSNSSLAARFGLGSDVADFPRKHRLRWLGHLARMDLCVCQSKCSLRSYRRQDLSTALKKNGVTVQRRISGSWIWQRLVISTAWLRIVGSGVRLSRHRSRSGALWSRKRFCARVVAGSEDPEISSVMSDSAWLDGYHHHLVMGVQGSRCVSVCVRACGWVCVCGHML